jgi:hypothetical protein
VPISAPQEFFQSIDFSDLRVTRPRRFIFLCGGIIDPDTERSPSARESFLRSLVHRSRFESHEIVLAEQIDTFYPDSPYKNLIKFEIDIALISDSVVLFSEGFGSLAELGAFSQIDPIADRMMVIVQSCHYGNKSFIRDGPIRHLEERDSKSVQVFGWNTVNDEGVLRLDEESFGLQIEDIKAAVRNRLTEMPDMMTLKVTDFGHKIIMATATCDVLGAATFEEVTMALTSLEIESSRDEVRRMLFCARAVGWLVLEQRGHTKFYLPNFERAPCNFSYGPAAPHKDTMRWKRDIRAYWKENDRLRWRLITEHPRRVSA